MTSPPVVVYDSICNESNAVLRFIGIIANGSLPNAILIGPGNELLCDVAVRLAVLNRVPLVTWQCANDHRLFFSSNRTSDNVIASGPSPELAATFAVAILSYFRWRNTTIIASDDSLYGQLVTDLYLADGEDDDVNTQFDKLEFVNSQLSYDDAAASLGRIPSYTKSEYSCDLAIVLDSPPRHWFILKWATSQT